MNEFKGVRYDKLAYLLGGTSGRPSGKSVARNLQMYKLIQKHPGITRIELAQLTSTSVNSMGVYCSNLGERIKSLRIRNGLAKYFATDYFLYSEQLLHAFTIISEEARDVQNPRS